MIDAPVAQLVRDLDDRPAPSRSWSSPASSDARDHGRARSARKKDQAINIPDVMSEPRHYGMHRHSRPLDRSAFGGGIKKDMCTAGKAESGRARRSEANAGGGCATIYHALGIPADTAYVNEKRPVM
jgi:hypothetical protein